MHVLGRNFRIPLCKREAEPPINPREWCLMACFIRYWSKEFLRNQLTRSAREVFLPLLLKLLLLSNFTNLLCSEIRLQMLWCREGCVGENSSVATGTAEWKFGECKGVLLCCWAVVWTIHPSPGLYFTLWFTVVPALPGCVLLRTWGRRSCVMEQLHNLCRSAALLTWCKNT